MVALRKILVTGGAGFIGSHSVLALLEAGYEVVAVDNFVNAVAGAPDDGEGRAVSLRRVERLTGKQVPFVRLDVCDAVAMDKLFSEHKFDCVMHFAALKAVGESVKLPLLYYKNNLIGALVLLETMQKHKVRNFVFSSSATVYGTPHVLPVSESHPTGADITNPYGQTKYMMERMLIDFCTANKDWNVTLLRYFNPVGGHESGDIGEDPAGVPNNLMPYVAQVAVGKLPHVNVFGNDYDTPDGTGVRDYIHVMDLALGHVAALNYLESHPDAGCKAFNLGTGRGYSVLEMIAAMEKASGKKSSSCKWAEIAQIPYKIGGRRAGDVASMYCDPSLASAELRWTAGRDIDTMCADLWRWQTQNPDGFRTAK